MRRLFDALCAGDARAALTEAGEILDAGTDPAELLRQCLRHSHDLMIAKAQGPRVEGESELRRALDAQAKAFSEATLVHSVTIFGEALKNSKLLGESRLFAETALARLAGHRDMRFLDQMVREIQSLERRLGAGGATAPAAPASRVAATVDRPVAATGPSSAEAPSQAAPAAPATSPASQQIDLTLDAIRGRWNDVREASSSAGSRVRTALTAATVEGLRGDVLVLGFTADASFQRGVLTAPDMRDPIAALLETVLGRRLRVEAVEIAKDAAAAAPAAEASRRAEQQGERLTAAERSSAEQAPITRLVEKELKARIVSMERTSERGSTSPARSGELADPSRQE
jgi:DNA polymerase III gamma/tau subunit